MTQEQFEELLLALRAINEVLIEIARSVVPVANHEAMRRSLAAGDGSK